MNKKRLTALRIIMPLIAIICLVIFPPWILVKAWISPKEDTVQEQIEKSLDYELDGIIVYVDEKGKDAAYYAAGWNNRENQLAAKPDDLFKIASIGKLYVASSIAKLAANGTISLDETLDHYYPEFVGRIENIEKITLRMMVMHRSGIYNYSDNPNYPWGDLPETKWEVLDYALDQEAEFEPGEDYKYSNTNYLLLTDIIEKEVGYSHLQYIKEAIVEPLGLKNTYGTMKEVDMDDVMSGYYVGWEPDVKVNYHASMIATAEDVGIFLRALNDGSLLSAKEDSIYASIYEYEHTGLLPGYQSIARYHKDIDAVIVQFVNTSGGEAWSLHEILYKKVVKIVKEDA